MRWVALLASASAMGLATPALGQNVAQVAAEQPVTAVAPVPVADSDVGPFYSARPGVLVWLKDEQGRAAVARLIEILKHSDIDGFADGPSLASSVETRGLRTAHRPTTRRSPGLGRYVLALKRPSRWNKSRRSDAAAETADADEGPRQRPGRIVARPACQLGRELKSLLRRASQPGDCSRTAG